MDAPAIVDDIASRSVAGRVASRALAHPIVIASIAILILNDHFLKASYPGFITGKLSDIAGLIFFPLLLAAAAEHIHIRRGLRAIVIAALATGLVFTLVKLGPAADFYRAALAVLQWPFRAAASLLHGHGLPPLSHILVVEDPTDLLALPALVVPVVIARR